MPKSYTTKTGNRQIMQSAARLAKAIAADEMIGFCLACGAEASNCEPDARKYSCESCQQPKVYGAEELLLMNICY